jgi:fumarate hydratase class II|tara:strand:+ start:12217 stop:13608 length:1392 start_codon:yes stop_codon:yes gene_type:complete
MKKSKNNFRVESDSMGEVKIPKNALYGAQTQRAVDNFIISDLVMPKEFIISLLLVKIAAAKANAKLGLLSMKISTAIIKSAEYLISNFDHEDFPIDVFQTGSGTSTNMNVNEVISNIAKSKFKTDIHPNDHVNMSQSSNDVIPTAISHCAYKEAVTKLLPSLSILSKDIGKKQKKLNNIVKTGRTHLMDAMPITFGQEISSWKAQIDDNIDSLKSCLKRVKRLPIGGTAVGTGINAHKQFPKEFLAALNSGNKLNYVNKKNKFEGLSSQDDIVLYSSHLKSVAVSLIKISNDLRWMNSGPGSGISDITLKALQPGSSIMPGKVNPVIPESAIMACSQVIGNDTTIMICGQSGNFQLNVTLPVIAYNIVQSTSIISNTAISLSKKSILDFHVNKSNIENSVNSNPILVTALNRIIGYEKGAYIAKKAYKLGLPIIDVAIKETDLSKKELQKILDPLDLTKGGIK